MIDPDLEIFVGDYITIKGSNNFYEVLKILPTKDAVIIQTVNDDVRVVHRPLIKGVISKEAMLRRESNETLA